MKTTVRARSRSAWRLPKRQAIGELDPVQGDEHTERGSAGLLVCSSLPQLLELPFHLSQMLPRLADQQLMFIKALGEVGMIGFQLAQVAIKLHW